MELTPLQQAAADQVRIDGDLADGGLKPVGDYIVMSLDGTFDMSMLDALSDLQLLDLWIHWYRFDSDGKQFTHNW